MQLPNKSKERGYPLNLLDAVASMEQKTKSARWGRPLPDDLNAAVDAALGCLSVKQHEMLLYKFRDGLTYREAAIRLNVGEHRCAQILEKALRKLQGARPMAFLENGAGRDPIEYDEAAIFQSMPAYVRSALARWKEIRGIRQLAGLTEPQAAYIRGVGPEGVAAMKTALAKCGLSFKAPEAKPEPEGLPPTSVYNCGLGTRARNALARAGYKDLKDLDGMAKSQAMLIRDIGKGALAEIEQAMARHGLSLAE